MLCYWKDIIPLTPQKFSLTLKKHADSKHDAEDEDVACSDAKQGVEFLAVESLQVF